MKRLLVKTRVHYEHVSPIQRPYTNIKSISAPSLLIIDYNNFIKMLEKKEVKSVELTSNTSVIKVKTKDDLIDVNVPKSKSIDLMNKLNKYDIDVDFKENADYSQLIFSVIFYLFTGSIILGIIMQQRKNNPMQFLNNNNNNVIEGVATDITFDDVAGLTSAKEDLKEIIEFLKNPDKFKKLGAKIPKGCLLQGPSGLGKTLLAKAISGEAGVPFFSASGSGFIELFVGMGASRVRELFKKAKDNAPCIIFIDEIDAIGKARGGLNIGGANTEHEQTINQLLVEMDGFKESTGVIIIGATNRVDVLDSALLRPGRFDRIIEVELPDLKDRIAILKVHTKNKPLHKDFDITSIAKNTTGLSGADLANLANEAAILAARNNKDIITMDDFDHAFEKIAIGPKKDSIVSEDKRRLVAYHEAGHALVALKVGVFDNVKKVSIVARGKTGGVTIFEPDEENNSLVSREYLENQIAVALGGRITEEIVFGSNKVTTGASNDILRVQHIARHMITHYGLNHKLGPIAWHNDIMYSTNTLSLIDNEIIILTENIYFKTKAMLLKSRDQLDRIAEALLEKETLSGSDLNILLHN
jgi:cell division protease FtsH